jgi:hypothetical protein
MRVDEERAAALLGLTTRELRRLSMRIGLGCPASGTDSEHRVFTYAELYRMCRFAVQVVS